MVYFLLNRSVCIEFVREIKREPKMPLRKILTGTCLFIAASQSQAITIATDASVSDVIPGVAAFTTSGAQMAGMSVTATFDSGVVESRTWAATGANSGGVTGSNWSLDVSSATTFDINAWSFLNSTGAGLTGLVLDGRGRQTMFDRTFSPFPGTPDSANGSDFQDNVNAVGTATYSRQVAVGANAPVGDLWRILTVSFDQSVTATSWSFTQDTDNDIRITGVPAPATLALLGLGLAGFGFRRHS
jgi:hypothetical protein